MPKLVRTLMVLPFMVFPLVVYAENSAPVFWHLIGTLPSSHSVNEVAQVNIAIDPRQDFAEPPLITYRLVLVGGHPAIVNAVDDTASIVGFGRFKIKHRAAQTNGQASIDVNGQELCCVDVVDNRMTYVLNLQLGRTANFLSGGEFPIPAATRASATTVIFDSATGETRSADVLPIAVLDDNSLSSPFN